MAKKIPDETTLIHINQYNTKEKKNWTCWWKYQIQVVYYYTLVLLILLVLYHNTSDYNKFTSDILDLEIKQKELVDKSDISIPLKRSDLNTKLSGLATRKGL